MTCAMLFSAAACFLAGSLISSSPVRAQDMSNGADNFYTSEKVTMQKVTFNNQYKMKVAGNLFIPKGLTRMPKVPLSSSAIRWAR